MNYIITNGADYLVCNHGEKRRLSQTQKEATVFKSAGKANNVLSIINKEFKNIGLRIQRLDQMEDLTHTNSLQEPIELDFDIVEKFNEFSLYLSELRKRKVYLYGKLSEADKYKVDAEHHIENYNLNVVDGYKEYKNLQVVLKERRKIKNEIDLIEFILKLNCGNIGIDTIDKKLKSIENWVYVPRINHELFSA